MPFLNDAHFDFIDGKDRIYVAEDLRFFEAKTGRLIKIPQGFISDGASIPRLLWARFGHPFAASHRAEAVLHDYLCRHGGEINISRAEADAIFRRALIERGEKSVYACWLFWLGVRLGAFFGVGKPE